MVLSSPMGGQADMSRTGFPGTAKVLGFLKIPVEYSESEILRINEWPPALIAQALRGELIARHYDLMERRFDEKLTVVLIRKFVCRYSTARPEERILRNEIYSVQNREEFFQVVDDFLR